MVNFSSKIVDLGVNWWGPIYGGDTCNVGLKLLKLPVILTVSTGGFSNLVSVGHHGLAAHPCFTPLFFSYYYFKLYLDVNFGFEHPCKYK